MAERKPVVLVGGQLKELPADDTLPAQAPATHSHPTSDVTGLDDALAGKQAALVSGENIKSVNGNSLLGSGNLTISGGAPAPVDAISITYNGDGTIDTVTEDGVEKTFAYNADGTIDTVSWPVGALTRTETYSYTSGVLSGMTATEA